MSDKLKKFTHKEINEAAMAARNAAELVYSLATIREQNPINKMLRSEGRTGSINYYRYNEYEIESLINFLVAEKENGATHFSVAFDNDDSELLISTEKMKAETPAEWMERVTQIRDRKLDQVYGQKQREMLAQNEKIETYLRLKRELGE
jgi:hypothetical protein